MLLISFLYLCLHIAIIIIIALGIVWLCKLFGIAIDDQVYKVGKIIVLILILIAVVYWLYGIGPSLGLNLGMQIDHDRSTMIASGGWSARMAGGPTALI